MCAASKKEEDPSEFGVYFCGFFMAVVGVLAGVIYLSSFSALAFSGEKDLSAFIEDRAKKPIKPGDLFFMEGAVLRSNTWQSKRQSLLSGVPGTVDLAHGEFNAWLASKFRPAAAPSGDEQTNLMILPGVPNAYFSADAIYLSLPTEIILFGSSHKYTVFAKGHLAADGEPQFVLESLNVSNASVPWVGFIGQRLIDTLLKAYADSDEYLAIEAAWSRVESVEQSSGVLRMQLR